MAATLIDRRKIAKWRRIVGTPKEGFQIFGGGVALLIVLGLFINGDPGSIGHPWLIMAAILFWLFCGLCVLYALAYVLFWRYEIIAWFGKRLPRGPDRTVWLIVLFALAALAAGEICCDAVSQDYVAPGDGWP